MGIHDGKKVAEALAPDALRREMPRARADYLVVDMMCHLYAFQHMDVPTPRKLVDMMMADIFHVDAPYDTLVLVSDKRRLKELTAPKAAEAEKRMRAQLAYYASRGMRPPEPYPVGTRFTDAGVLGPNGEEFAFHPSRVVETVRHKDSTMAWWRYVQAHVEGGHWTMRVECRFEDIPTDDADVPLGTYGEADLEIIHYLLHDVPDNARVYVLTLDTDFMAHYMLYCTQVAHEVIWIQDVGHYKKTSTGARGDWVPPWVLDMVEFRRAMDHVPPTVFARVMLLMGTDFVERGWWVHGVTSVNAASLTLTPQLSPMLEIHDDMRSLTRLLIRQLQVEHTRTFRVVDFGVAEEAAFRRAHIYWTRAIPTEATPERWRECVRILRANSHAAALEHVSLTVRRE